MNTLLTWVAARLRCLLAATVDLLVDELRFRLDRGEPDPATERTHDRNASVQMEKWQWIWRTVDHWLPRPIISQIVPDQKYSWL